MARRGFDRRDPEPNLSGLDPAQHVQRIVEAAEEAANQIREEAEAEAQRYLEDYKRRVDRLVSERMQLTETLAEQTGRIKDQYDRFLSALDGALEKIGQIAGNGQSASAPPESARSYGKASAEPRLGPDPLAPPERASRDLPPEPGPAEREYEERPASRWSRWRSEGAARAEPEPRPEQREASYGGAPETTPGGYRPRRAAKGERLLAMELLAAGESRAEIERRLREEFSVAEPAALIDELLGD